MNLGLEKIKEITSGAVNIEENEGNFEFHRFTIEQENLYKQRNDLLYLKCFATAGVKLAFRTNSCTLSIKAIPERATVRDYVSIDVFVNGKPIGYLDNFSDTVFPPLYTTVKLPFNELSKTFSLGDGEKDVVIYLPWSVKLSLSEISVDDGAFVQGLKNDKTLLLFGDSITQGFDSLRPSDHYTIKLAQAMGADVLNKAIGAEVYIPELASIKEEISPDYIIVAYGSNDWGTLPQTGFRERCVAFYKAIEQNYPCVKTFVITPIWRKDMIEEKEFGPFENVATIIQDAANGFENITVIPGFDLVPHEETYFGDLRLHPNSAGFDYYYNGIINAIKPYL